MPRLVGCSTQDETIGCCHAWMIVTVAVGKGNVLSSDETTVDSRECERMVRFFSSVLVDNRANQKDHLPVTVASRTSKEST